MFNLATDTVTTKRNRLQAMFFGMENYALVMNRTYLVIVTDHMVSGAKVIGVSAAPTSGEDVESWRNPFSRISKSVIRNYENVVPEMPEFLKADSANFQINIGDITEVSFKRRKRFSVGAIPHCGTLLIKTKDGKKREFIVIGEINAEAIVQRIVSLRDQPPAAYFEGKDVRLECGPGTIKALLCTIGHAADFDTLRREDQVHYEKLPADVSVFRAENLPELFDYLKGKSFDIIHLFARFDSGSAGIGGYPTLELMQHLQPTGVKLVISAYNNREILKGVTGITMLMTLDRNGDAFSRFCTHFFDMLLNGSSFFQAFFEIFPQQPFREVSQDSDFVLIPAGGDYKLFSANLLEKLFIQTIWLHQNVN